MQFKRNTYSAKCQQRWKIRIKVFTTEMPILFKFWIPVYFDFDYQSSTCLQILIWFATYFHA